MVLCEDEIIKILSFLPAKSIVKFRILSSNFLYRSTSNHFLLTQSHHTKADVGFFTQPYFEFVDLIFLHPNVGIPGENLRFLQHTGRIVLVSANGLVFFFDHRKKLSSLCVFNPVHPIATMRSIPLPPSTGEEDYNRSCFAVCFSTSRDYKLVCLTTTPEWNSFYWCMVYVSVENAWKFSRIIDGGPRNLQLEYPVIRGTTVYVASTCGSYMRTDPYILAFDIQEEGSRILSLPEEVITKRSDHDHEINIAGWDEKSVCLIDYHDSSMFKLWVMSRDGETTTWTEIYRVSMMEMGIANPEPIYAFTLINGDTLVFVMNTYIYGYHIKEQVLKELRNDYPSTRPTLIPYANSLRPC